MRRLFFVIILGSISSLVSAEEPDFKKLVAPSFKEREAAHSRIVQWIGKDQSKAQKVLLRRFLRSSEPEEKRRLLRLIERAYFPMSHGFMGIQMDRPRINAFGNQRGKPQPAVDGVFVALVVPGTAADRAGIKKGDYITHINDWRAQGGYDLRDRLSEEIAKHPPGEKIQVGVRRAGKEIKIPMQLGLRPVPSERVRLAGGVPAGQSFIRQQILPTDLAKELTEFDRWLNAQIENERKNLASE